MSLLISAPPLPPPPNWWAHKLLHWKSRVSASSVPLVHSVGKATCSNSGISCSEETRRKIQKLFQKVELSVSSYDTAWVAMVPSPDHPRVPCFPECVNWLLNNQLPDGSWGLPFCSPSISKDVLSSTLACVLALRKWGIGEEHIKKGIHFVESNFSLATACDQLSPVGFGIIFPSMLEYAKDFDLKLNVEPGTITTLLKNRNLLLERYSRCDSPESSAYLAYLSEGLGDMQDWKMVTRYQRKNGSLFNSPATTAAALSRMDNSGCLDYLRSVLRSYGNSVPAVYPLDVYARLYMISKLEKLGICRHFMTEIKTVLDETHRCWLQGEEEIFEDVTTCAIAFRVLRKNGYDVSSDPLTRILEKSCFFELLDGNFTSINSVLEVHQASEMVIHSDESALEKYNILTKRFLKQLLPTIASCSDRLSQHIHQEVDHCLKFPSYANLERIVTRRTIKHYNVDEMRILKTSYCSPNFSNKDFLTLAAEDFNFCQSIHREECQQIERWVISNKLDQLQFARQKSAYCHFSAAATIFSPELSDARLSWAKNGVLTTVVDDFFDVGGSIAELKNLIELVEMWDGNISNCCSENVEILFSALYSTIRDIADKAFIWQARDVTSEIIDIWLNLLYSMLKEAEWAGDSSVPSVSEYMENGYISFAIGPIILPALYFIGPKLSDDIFRHPELHNLFKLTGTCGRLLNDIQSFERESQAGKLNAVSLYVIHGSGLLTEAAATQKIHSMIKDCRRELLRSVLRTHGSMVPRTCKDLFWNMCKVLHQFYIKDDGFTSLEMGKVVKAVIYDQVMVPF